MREAPTDRLRLSPQAQLERSDRILNLKWQTMQPPPATSTYQAAWERPAAPKNPRLLATIANNKSW